MRIAVVGNFYPGVFRVAPVTTGLVYLLSKSSRVDHVTVYCPFGSCLPPQIARERVGLRPSWSPDSISSLAACALRLARESSGYDALLFNLYLTAFGKNPVANGIGLMTPVFLRRLSGRRPVVYMHNFLETEDAAKLGYDVGRFERGVVRMIESALLEHTEVVVPLPAQRETIERTFGFHVRQLVIPYVEGILIAGANRLDSLSNESAPHSDRTRVLLFGAWGPQKDLAGALQLLRDVDRQRPLEVTVAGGANPNFPEHAGLLKSLEREFSGPHCRFLGKVPEEMVPSIFQRADCLLLPYHAMGGYSGVLSTCALFDVPIIAYRVPGIRDFAASLEQPIELVDPRDPAGFIRAMDSLDVRRNHLAQLRPDRVELKVEKARSTAEQLVDILEGASLSV